MYTSFITSPFVLLVGFEPTTSAFEAQNSNPLSYRSICREDETRTRNLDDISVVLSPLSYFSIFVQEEGFAPTRFGFPIPTSYTWLRLLMLHWPLQQFRHSCILYPQRDSNSQTLRHQILSLACLPIPP